jgi:multidrug resistance efflux pump
MIKQDVSKLMKEKEDFRREHELDHFTARTEEGHAHEKGVRVQLLEQEKRRKEAELAHKKQQISEVKRQLIDKEQDIMQLEAQLRHVMSGG